MTDSDSDTYTVPTRDQRVFGAGLKRKRVRFVPAASTSPPTTDTTAVAAANSLPSGSSVANTYLSIVLPKQRDPTPPDTEAAAADPLSLTAQLTLPHSHPPSSLSRTRLGVALLARHGWDPDSRRGLGPESGPGGRLYPVKVVAKRDTVGLGVRRRGAESPEGAKGGGGNGGTEGGEKGGGGKGGGGREGGKAGGTERKRLDARETRLDQARRAREHKRLEEGFWRDEGVDAYLRALEEREASGVKTRGLRNAGGRRAREM